MEREIESTERRCLAFRIFEINTKVAEKKVSKPAAKKEESSSDKSSNEDDETTPKK